VSHQAAQKQTTNRVFLGCSACARAAEEGVKSVIAVKFIAVIT